MSNVKDAVDYALEGNLADMTASLEAAIKDKVLGAIEAKKAEVAQSMFNPVAEGIEDSEDEYDDEYEDEEDEELNEGHSMHTHTVHFSSPESGEWKGKILINADSDKEAVADAHAMAKKQGLKVMRVSKNNSVMVDKTIGEEVVYESESPEKVLMGLKYGKAKPSAEEMRLRQRSATEVKPMPSAEEMRLRQRSMTLDGGPKPSNPYSTQTDGPKPHKGKNIKHNSIHHSLDKPYNKFTKEGIEQVDEKLEPSMGAKEYVHDFVHSKNKKFSGKSKEERIKQALGAYYAAKRGK